MIDFSQLKPDAPVVPATDGVIDTAKAYARADAELKAAQAEVRILKEQLAEQTAQQWLDQNKGEYAPTVNLELTEKTVAVGRRRSTALKNEIPQAAKPFFEESFKISIDGSKIAKSKQQAVVDAIAKIVPSGAVKVDAGYRVKATALSDALDTGNAKIIAAVEACFSPTVTVK